MIGKKSKKKKGCEWLWPAYAELKNVISIFLLIIFFFLFFFVTISKKKETIRWHFPPSWNYASFLTVWYVSMLTLVPNSFFIFHAIPHQSRDSRSYLIPTHIHSRFVDDVPGGKKVSCTPCFNVFEVFYVGNLQRRASEHSIVWIVCFIGRLTIVVICCFNRSSQFEWCLVALALVEGFAISLFFEYYGLVFVYLDFYEPLLCCATEWMWHLPSGNGECWRSPVKARGVTSGAPCVKFYFW